MMMMMETEEIIDFKSLFHRVFPLVDGLRKPEDNAPFVQSGNDAPLRHQHTYTLTHTHTHRLFLANNRPFIQFEISFQFSDQYPISSILLSSSFFL